MLPDQIIDEAESLCTDYGVTHPTTRSVMYTRINQCQRRLFANVAEVDTEYYGLQVRVRLDSAMCADLSKIREATGALPIERIDDVRIAESVHADQIGKRVRIVPLNDAEAHQVPPRATIRSHAFAGFGDDLAGVSQVDIYYTRCPRTIRRDGLVEGAEAQIEVELESPWDFLLVWDLVAHLITLAPQLDKERKELLMELVMARFNSLRKEYLAHVVGFVHMRQDRHS